MCLHDAHVLLDIYDYTHSTENLFCKDFGVEGRGMGYEERVCRRPPSGLKPCPLPPLRPTRASDGWGPTGVLSFPRLWEKEALG